jgi:tetratricopeptide (TPR) repeat protein
MFRLKIFLFSILISGTVFSQTPAEAGALFESGNYSEAVVAYGHLLKKNPKDALYQYRLGVSAYETGDFEKAIAPLENAGNKYPQRHFYLGKIYFDNYLFEQAATAYENYLNSLSPEEPGYPEIEKNINRAKLGARFITRIEDVEIVDSVVVDKKNFLAAISLPADLGTLKQQRLHMGENKLVDHMQYTTQRGDRMYSSEYLDENSDLFTSLKLLDEWAEKQPLNDLNTESNENYPFLLLDGITLYFASDGEDSMGGYDIFITRLNTSENSFLKPENIGMPFNSPFNDYMFMMDEFRNIGWFASDRYQPEGKLAVYQFIPNKEKKIVRSESPDSLISRARIEEFSGRKINLPEQALKNQSTNVSPRAVVFINNRVSYSGANDFKSNEARNHYFQLQKLTEEKQIVETELKNLRVTYSSESGQQRHAAGQRILELESRLRTLPHQIKTLEKMMRNAENIVLVE